MAQCTHDSRALALAVALGARPGQLVLLRADRRLCGSGGMSFAAALVCHGIEDARRRRERQAAERAGWDPARR